MTNECEIIVAELKELIPHNMEVSILNNHFNVPDSCIFVKKEGRYLLCIWMYNTPSFMVTSTKYETYYLSDPEFLNRIAELVEKLNIVYMNIIARGANPWKDMNTEYILLK